MTIDIKLLEPKYLDSAIQCVRASFQDIFAYTDLPEISLKVTLNPSLIVNYPDMQRNISERQYWIGLHGNRVVSLCGLMVMEEDKAVADWLNWFCVHPDFRRKGYGRSLLIRSIEESLNRGKKYLRLWTSNSPNEQGAQFLYDDMGFFITSEALCNEGYCTVRIYREKFLAKVS